MTTNDQATTLDTRTLRSRQSRPARNHEGRVVDIRGAEWYVATGHVAAETETRLSSLRASDCERRRSSHLRAPYYPAAQQSRNRTVPIRGLIEVAPDRQSGTVMLESG